MPDTLHEFTVEITPPTMQVTVFALTRDEAADRATDELEQRLLEEWTNGTWWISDCGPVEMEDAETPQESAPDGRHP